MSDSPLIVPPDTKVDLRFAVGMTRAYGAFVRHVDEKVREGLYTLDPVEVQAAVRICIRIQRWAECMVAAGSTGSHDETFAIGRMPLELLLSQCLILYVPLRSQDLFHPVLPDTPEIVSSAEKARAFEDWGDVRRLRLIRARPSWRPPDKTQDEYSDFVQKLESRVKMMPWKFAKPKAKYANWAGLPLQLLHKKVVTHLPEHLREPDFELLFGHWGDAIGHQHEAVHASSFTHGLMMMKAVHVKTGASLQVLTDRREINSPIYNNGFFTSMAAILNLAELLGIIPLARALYTQYAKDSADLAAYRECPVFPTADPTATNRGGSPEVKMTPEEPRHIGADGTVQ